MKHKEKGRRQTALPPEKSVRFFDHLPIPAFVRPDSSEYPARSHPGNLFFHSFEGYSYPLASAVAPSVLSCESKAMIFSLFFTFFSLLLAGFSLLFILASYYDKSSMFMYFLSICTLPCTRSSKYVLCRKPYTGSFRLPEYMAVCRCFGSPGGSCG